MGSEPRKPTGKQASLKDSNFRNGETLIAPDDLETLKFALAAYDTANTHAMRLWYAAALVSIPILIHGAGLGEAPNVLDMRLTMSALIAILSALNLIFVIAQVSHHRMASVYRSVVKKLFSNNEKVSPEFTWKDLAMRAPVAGHNRIMPLLEAFDLSRGGLSACSIRMGFNLAFGLFPVASLIFGLHKLSPSSPLYVSVSLVGAVSVIIGLFVIGQYAYRGFRECREESKSDTNSS